MTHDHVIEACASVLEEAVARGEKLPHHLHAYLPKQTAERCKESLQQNFWIAYREGYRRRTEE